MKRIVVIISLILISIFIYCDEKNKSLYPFLINIKPAKESKFGYMDLELVKWGYMDIDGKVIIKPKFSYARDFKEGYAIVQIQERVETDTSFKVYTYWGVIDHKGNYIIEPKFKRISDFSEGLAKASLPNISIFDKDYEKLKSLPRHGFIDKTGEFIIIWNLNDFRYNQTSDFSEGLARVAPPITVKKAKQIIKDEQLLNTIIGFFGDDENQEVATSNNPVGFIDKKGKLVIENKFRCAGVFIQGLASAQPYDLEKFGYIDNKGNYIIKPEFDDAYGFAEDYAVVSKNKKYGYINKDGKIIIEPKFDYAFEFSEGMAMIQLNEKYGFINKKGEIVVKAEYYSAGNFSSGLAAVGKLENNKIIWGFIDKNGKLVIPFQFTGWEAPSFKNDLALVQITIKEKSEEEWNKGQLIDVNKKGYINKNGKWIYGPIKGPWDIHLD